MQANTTPTPRRRRRWPLFLAILFVLMVSPFVILATAVAATGTVTVQVEDHSADGVDFILPVPALLIDAAAFVAPRVIPDDALADIRRETAPYRASLLEVTKEIEDCPNGVLVDVQSGSEHVLVTKQGNRVRVQVNGPDIDVRVSVPDRVVRRALQAAGIV